jgi:hypothetical protein
MVRLSDTAVLVTSVCRFALVGSVLSGSPARAAVSEPSRARNQRTSANRRYPAVRLCVPGGGYTRSSGWRCARHSVGGDLGPHRDRTRGGAEGRGGGRHGLEPVRCGAQQPSQSHAAPVWLPVVCRGVSSMRSYTSPVDCGANDLSSVAIVGGENSVV